MPFQEINYNYIQPSKFPAGLSAYCVVHNGEKTLDLVLNTIRPYVDELIIINQASTDKTEEISKKYATHYEYRDKALGYPEPDRQYCIDIAKYSHILQIDSDELFTQPLLWFIKNQFIKQNNYDGLRCQIISIFEDRIPSIEYCCKNVCYKKDNAKIKPILHQQVEGLNNLLDRPELVMLHLQGSSRDQLKKLDEYDKVVEKTFQDGLINEKTKTEQLGINSKSRGQMK